MTKCEQSMSAVEYARHMSKELDKWIDRKRRKEGNGG